MSSRAEPGRILATARANNRQLGVTGALLFTEVSFAQILEGPLGPIETKFERIRCDLRHSDMAVLRDLIGRHDHQQGRLVPDRRRAGAASIAAAHGWMNSSGGSMMDLDKA